MYYCTFFFLMFQGKPKPRGEPEGEPGGEPVGEPGGDPVGEPGGEPRGLVTIVYITLLIIQLIICNCCQLINNL